jgi:hypothetical protein
VRGAESDRAIRKLRIPTGAQIPGTPRRQRTEVSDSPTLLEKRGLKTKTPVFQENRGLVGSNS